MKYDRPSSSESWTRMLVCRSHGGIRSRAAQTGAPACASTALRPIARSSVLLPDMFEPVTSRSVPGGPDLDVVRDAAAAGNQRVPERLGRQAPALADRRACPLRVVAAGGGERRQRIDVGDGGHPAAHAGSRHPAPAVQSEEHVEVPERQRLDGEMEKRCRRAKLAESEDAVQPAHACRRRDTSGGQARPQFPERRRLDACRGHVFEKRRIPAQGLLPGARPIQLETIIFVMANERMTPSRSSTIHQPDDASSAISSHMDPGMMSVDRPQQRTVGAKRPRALGPRDERVDFTFPGTQGQHAVRRELFAPLVVRGELRNRGLAVEDIVRRSGRQEPFRQPAPAGRSRRRDPATERGTPGRRGQGPARTDDARGQWRTGHRPTEGRPIAGQSARARIHRPCAAPRARPHGPPHAHARPRALRSRRRVRRPRQGAADPRRSPVSR